MFFKLEIKKFIQPQSIGYLALGAFIILGWLLKFLRIVYGVEYIDWNSFGVTDLLLNYQGGFVRRGLLGEIIYKISSFSSISPLIIIVIFSFVSYFVVFIFLFWEFYKKRYIWWLILTPFLCGLVDTIIRKDYFLYVLIIIEMYISRKGLGSLKHTILLTIISTFGILCHEAFLFFGIPLVLLMVFQTKKYKNILVYCMPILLTAILSMIFKGNKDVSNAIIESINSLLEGTFVSQNIENTINSLKWTTEYVRDYHWRVNISCVTHPNMPIVYVILIRIVFLFFTYYFITNFFNVFKFRSKFSDRDRILLSSLYIFAIFCLLPMFLLFSCDYGRLYQYAWMVTFISFLVFPHEKLCKVFGKQYMNISLRLSDNVNKIIKPNKCIIIILLLFLSTTPTSFCPEWALGLSPGMTCLKWIFYKLSGL